MWKTADLSDPCLRSERFMEIFLVRTILIYNSILIKLGPQNLKLGPRFDDDRDDISPLYGRGRQRDEGFTDKYKGP
jgi:hypothetical protein